jgi:CheY-like chemotaxis protein
MSTILVVDDELGIRALLSEILSDEGHTVVLAENAAQARAERERTRLDLVLLDIWMPDVDGITLLKEWGVQGRLTMPVVMMSGHGTVDTGPPPAAPTGRLAERQRGHAGADPRARAAAPAPAPGAPIAAELRPRPPAA